MALSPAKLPDHSRATQFAWWTVTSRCHKSLALAWSLIKRSLTASLWLLDDQHLKMRFGIRARLGMMTNDGV